jgi:hypothetical protein
VVGSSAEAKWYVTFSGETGKKIQNVFGLDARGNVVQDKVLDGAPHNGLSELRWDGAGRGRHALRRQRL